jgi:hypothetical protein
MKKIHLILITLLFSTESYAIGESGWTTVSEVFIGRGNKPLVKLTSMGMAPVDCARVDYLRISRPSGTGGSFGSFVDRQYETLTLALEAGLEVNITTDECDSSFALISQVKVRKPMP